MYERRRYAKPDKYKKTKGGGGESEETIVSIKSVGADYFVGQQVPPYEQLLLANTVFNIQRR